MSCSVARGAVYGLAFSVVCGLSVASASATTLHVEPPDLSNDLNTPTPLGDIGLGVNTISGGVSGTWQQTGPFTGNWTGDVTDAFAYNVPNGLKVTGFELNVTNFSTNVSSVFGESSTTTAGVDTDFFSGDEFFANLLTGGQALPVGAYDYAMNIAQTCPACSFGNLSYDWQINITTEIDELLYAEPADLSNDLNTPTDLGDLHLGVNRVQGGISGSWLEVFGGTGNWTGDVTDAFMYSVPAGMMVSNFELVVTNFSTNVSSVFGEPATTTGGVDDSFFFPDDASYANILTGGYLPEGDYDFSMNIANTCPGCFSGNLSYDWEAILTLAICGDLDNDGFVGIADLNIVLGMWNQNVTPGSLADGDIDGDGFVGIADLNKVLGNWNAGTPPTGSSAVPEPAGVLVMVGLGAAFVSRRRV